MEKFTVNGLMIAKDMTDEEIVSARNEWIDYYQNCGLVSDTVYVYNPDGTHKEVEYGINRFVADIEEENNEMYNDFMNWVRAEMATSIMLNNGADCAVFGIDLSEDARAWAFTEILELMNIY